ncbi:3-keto-5-aminohexanoate cleavage protein [Actinopolymorpha alba]|uniref:3-keto-5-aminohexanoate cleavage protein n=1 Tax=Actinopolymorpha alba TaxID=533267 RepID=UPI000369A943|nr:3-keto-5-aminohexanoate cleavage protein [Actinopolymorpha alba]
MTRLLVAALNGGHSNVVYASVPVTPAELAGETARVVAAGATEVHVHPRRGDGEESLEPADVAAAIEAIRASVPGAPISVTTGAWIEPDPHRRAVTISRWRVLPNSASVNAHEDGALDVARVLRDRGVAVEVGLFTITAAEEFVRGPLRTLAARILIEPIDRPSMLALYDARSILELLDRHGVDQPRLLHGDGANTWPVLRRARQLGISCRVGFEDTFHLPDGTPAPHNAALIQAAQSAS